MNLNKFRNNHFSLNNDIKKAYTDLMSSAIEEAFEGYLVDVPVRIDYKIFFGDRRSKDMDNILSIVSKNFQDALVSCGVLEDDSYDHINETRYMFGGIERGQERVEITIHFNEVSGE